MPLLKRVNDSSQRFMSELTHRVVAASGIPTDRFHLGKIILQSFKDDPDFVMQIDGATGETETNGAAVERTVRCAISMTNFGLKCGDVITLMAPNHIELAVPFYAAMYLGVINAPVDMTLGIKELQQVFNVQKPKIIFCQSEKAPDIQLALNELESDAHIVTFDRGNYSFSDFLEQYGDDTAIEDFKPTDFNAEDTIALLVSTSGTTGLPKSAALTHKNIAITMPYLWATYTKFPSPIRLHWVVSPLQWMTAVISFCISPVMKYTRLQSSKLCTQEHAYHLINTYKPTSTIVSPTLMTSLIKTGDADSCDFSCFEIIMIGGSAVPANLVQNIKKITPTTEVFDAFGMSELSNVCFYVDHCPPGSSGKPIGCLLTRLINIETQEDIFEPNVPGELWVKGPGVFKEYYNNPKATAETFAEDRWFKTGDMFYRDENWNFFFVERIKLLLKYKGYQISPVELENLIRQHPGVLDVAVTGIPDQECGELPVACVVRRPGCEIDAQQIKQLVKETLSDSKQLRGGVIFLNEIPMTASTKVDRRKLKQMVINMKTE